MNRAQFDRLDNSALDALALRKAGEIIATPFKAVALQDIERRQWLYNKHLIRSFCSAKIAAPGIGKSALALTEAVAMATGRPILGVRPAQRCRVWYWNGEDPMDELIRRVAAICLHYNIDQRELEGWLFIDSGRDQEIVVANQTPAGARIAEPVVANLTAALLAREIDALIVDPFISSHRVTENDNNAIDLVTKRWAKIADTTQTAIELIHHSKKTGGADATVEDGRGAVALLASVRSAQVLNRMTKADGEKCGVENYRQYFNLENGKANLAPPLEDKHWYRIVSVNLGNGDPDKPQDLGDSVGVVTAWTYPNALDGVSGIDFELVATEVRAGQWRQSDQADAWIGKPIAVALGLDLSGAADRAKVKGLIKVWLASGALRIAEYQDGQRKVKKFIEIAD